MKIQIVYVNCFERSVIMRRCFCVLLALVMFLSVGLTGISSSAVEIDADQDVSVYSYPISADSEEWFEYSVREKVEMLRIPEFVLNSMTDEMLIQAIADYPYLVDIYLYGESVADGIDVARTYFSALDELLSRDTAAEALSTYGLNVAATHIASYQTDAEAGDYQDLFVARAVLDILNEVVEDVGSITDSGEYSLTDLTVEKTIHGADVVVLFRDENHDTEDHAAADQQIITQYGVTKISPGSCRYNCHSYAWYSQSTSNYYWINDPSPIMQVGTVNLIYRGGLGTAANSTSIRSGDIIFYGVEGGNTSVMHSAIYISTAYTSGVPIASHLCRSKWGEFGVFEHTMANVPAGYDINHISAWRTN